MLKYDKIKAVFRERDLLKMVYCQFVISLDCTLQDAENLYFVMEFAERGTLGNIIKKYEDKKIS